MRNAARRHRPMSKRRARPVAPSDHAISGRNSRRSNPPPDRRVLYEQRRLPAKNRAGAFVEEKRVNHHATRVTMRATAVTR